MTEARGNDPGYVPPNGGANSPARYTTVYTYDYQEGSDFAGLGRVLGISAAQVQQLLARAGIPMGLGDVNGDGQTDGLAGNLIRVDQPTVRLLAGSNEAAVEGSTSQPIVTLYTYNQFGQRTSQTDPEGNVTEDTYYPADSPDGSGVIEVPGADPTTGGYLASVATDTTSAAGRDSGTNPVPADIRDLYFYNPVGDVIRSVDGRGIATDYVVNQLNQVVETVEAAAHGVDTPAVAEPLPLTDFQYLERLYYDADNDIVLSEVEDRGNTSNVQGNPPAADLPILGVDLASVSTGRNGARTLDDTTQHWATNQWVGASRPDHVGAGRRRVRPDRLQHGEPAHVEHPLGHRPRRRLTLRHLSPDQPRPDRRRDGLPGHGDQVRHPRPADRVGGGGVERDESPIPRHAHALRPQRQRRC